MHLPPHRPYYVYVNATKEIISVGYETELEALVKAATYPRLCRAGKCEAEHDDQIKLEIKEKSLSEMDHGELLAYCSHNGIRQQVKGEKNTKTAILRRIYKEQKRRTA